MRLEVLTLQVTIGWMVLGAIFHLLCSRNNPLLQKSIAVVPTGMEKQAFIEPDQDNM